VNQDGWLGREDVTPLKTRSQPLQVFSSLFFFLFSQLWSFFLSNYWNRYLYPAY